MKFFKSIIISFLFLISSELRINEFHRKLEDISDLIEYYSDSVEDFSEVISDSNDTFTDLIDYDSINIASDISLNETSSDTNNFLYSSSINTTDIDLNSLQIENDTIISDIALDKNQTKNASIDTDIISNIINNNTNADPVINAITPKLILIGFGNLIRPEKQKELIIFKVFFKRILGRMPSKTLFFNLNINYLRRLGLRYLEESKANCLRITDDNNNDIQYNCSAPINKDQNNFKASIKGNDLTFGDGEKVDYTLSSYANSTKDQLEKQNSNYLENGILLLNSTVLTEDINSFTLTGNFSEEITDDKVVLFLDEKGDGNINNIYCDVINLQNKIYEFECTPTTSVNGHLQGIMGRTTNTAKDFVINFAQYENDIVNITVNNTNTDKNNNNNQNEYVNKKSSSGLSNGAIAGIIVGSAVALIAIIVIISCCLCCKNNKKLKIYEESENNINTTQNAYKL